MVGWIGDGWKVFLFVCRKLKFKVWVSMLKREREEYIYIDDFIVFFFYMIFCGIIYSFCNKEWMRLMGLC